MILFPYKPLKKTPFQTSQPQVKHAPKSDYPAVRVDAAMIPLQANNLAQDLLRFNWRIVADCSVTSQNKGEPTAVPFLYTHYAVGDERVLQAIEDNISPLKIGW